MPYDITTIGSMLAGSCECGGRKGLASLEPAQIAGLYDALSSLGEKMTIQYWARRAADKAREKIDAATEAARELDPRRIFDPLPIAIEVLGPPTWGYHVPAARSVVVASGVVAAGVVGYKLWKGKRSGSRRKGAERRT